MAHLFEQNIPSARYFNFILQAIRPDQFVYISFNSEQLLLFLETNNIIAKKNNGDNHELLKGELTYASEKLNDGENAIPDQFGTIVHEEQEGQKTACSRAFDDISRQIHGVPKVNEMVVVKHGAFKYNFGTVKCSNEDGSISVLFDQAVYSGGLSQQHALGDEVEINSVQFGCLTAVVALISFI